MWFKIILLTAFLGIIVGEFGASGLRCYHCVPGKKYTIEECSDPFKTDVANTKSNCTVCSKVKTSKFAARACEKLDASLGCSKTSVSGVETELCTCATDLCNRASDVTKATVIASAIGLACIVRTFCGD